MKRLMRTICVIVFILAVVLAALLARRVEAASEHMPLFWYGSEGDGKLGAPTAFADRWDRPTWLWDTVRDDRPGVALAGYAPGTWVRITVISMPSWASSWPELEGVVGRSVVAVVADRPGASWYADAWPLTFRRLAPLWVGKLYVRIEVLA